jgi:hypothetical protein
MRQIREVLRLRFASELPQRAIAKSLGLSQGAVSGYLSRARAAGVSWPLAEDLDDVQLEALLFLPPPAIAADQRPMPDWGWVHRELRRPNVTLALLWEEYRAGAPDGFGYSWFCNLYRGWAGRLKPKPAFAARLGEIGEQARGALACRSRRDNRDRPGSASIEDVDFPAHRGLDRALFLKLATCQWIREHHHLALGPDGYRQVVAGLRSRPQGLPRGLFGALHNQDLSSRQTGRQSSPQPAPASADHRPRAHAFRPPALSRLDPRAHPP